MKRWLNLLYAMLKNLTVNRRTWNQLGKDKQPVEFRKKLSQVTNERNNTGI